MNIHEYQAKNLLERYGIPTPPFRVASNREEVLEIVQELDLTEAVVKVQIHAGGRGKVGGVRLAKSRAEIVQHGEEMLGMKIINQQTGSRGIVAEKVLISTLVPIQKEYYLAAAIDRSLAMPVIIASPEGGMEIEEIAKFHPERILKVPIDREGKMRSYHLLTLAQFMGWSGPVREEGMELVAQLARAFIELDAELFEINPLVLTKEGHLSALDAKFSIDDNALYRQPAIAQWYDPSQSTPNEVLAKKVGLAYIGLEGDIGCLVNGAGLAMATMDTIQYHGGSPANFLDVGGSATKEQIAAGFKIIAADPKVQAIFVNIFGGIMDCRVLAQGIVEAFNEDPFQIPLIVRMEGTHVEGGREILRRSGLPIISALSMAEGAIQAIAATKKR